MLKSGSTLETAWDTYTLGESIGEGGVGHVFKAHDSDQTPRAIKVLKPGASSVQKKRFRNEMAVCMACRHPRVAQVLDFGIVGYQGRDAPFYVMPHFRSNLRQLMRDGLLEPDQAYRTVIQIADGLEYLHLKGCWHRDLKPENVLVGPEGAVVADLGAAHVSPDLAATHVATRPGDRLANFAYAAPEQRLSGGTVDQRADLFALGLIWNELVTGTMPHGTGYRTIASASEAHGWMDEIIERLLRSAAGDRFESVDAMKQAIQVASDRAVARQRVDRISGEVIQADGISDQIYEDPVRILSVDVAHGRIRCRLNHRISDPTWIKAYTDGVNGWTSRFDARSVRFDGDVAVIEVTEDYAVQALADFKQYLAKAEIGWATVCRRRQNAVLKTQQDDRARRLKDAELRQRLLATVTL